MDTEYEGIINRFVETGVSLMFITADNLLENKSIDMEVWKHIVDAYEILLMSPQSSLISRQVQAIGSLARAITASTPELASTYGTQIPSTSDDNLTANFAVNLYRAIEVKHRIERKGAKGVDNASLYFELGNSLYALLPFVQNEKRFSSALRVADIYLQSLQLLIVENDLAKAILAAINFVCIVNVFALTKYMAEALKWGEQLVMAANGQATDESRWYMLNLSSNLINTCKLLGKQRTSEAREYYEKGLALALNLKKELDSLGLGGLTELGVESEAYFNLYDKCMIDCVILSANLARVAPRQFEEYANKAWEYLREYSSLADKFTDPDLLLKAAQLRRQVYNNLREVQTDWVPPDADQENLEQPDLSNAFHQLEIHIDAYRSQAVDSAKQIKLLPNLEAQHEGITEALESRYREILLGLSTVLSEVGLNHHTCRFFLALGAIASCRMLTSQLLVSWILHIEKNDTQLSQYRKEVYTRQQIAAMSHIGDEIKLVGVMVGLAVFVESLQLISGLQKTLPLMLRDHNVKLLDAILGKALARRYDDRKLAATSDLVSLLQSFPEAVRSTFLKAYNQSRLD